MEVPELRGRYDPEVVLPVLLPEAGVAYAEPAIPDAAGADLAWRELVGGGLGVEEAALVAADLRAYASSVSHGMARLLAWLIRDPRASAPA